MSLPSPWDQIVEHGLLKFLVGPCPKCSAEATTAEQLVWPTVRPWPQGNWYEVHCARCNNSALEQRLGATPAIAVLGWSRRHWSGSPYWPTGVPESPHSVMVEALEWTARNWTENAGLVSSIAKKNEPELHAMVLQHLANQRKGSASCFDSYRGLPAVHTEFSGHFTEEARQTCVAALRGGCSIAAMCDDKNLFDNVPKNESKAPRKHLGAVTGRGDGPNPNPANIPKETPTIGARHLVPYDTSEDFAVGKPTHIRTLTASAFAGNDWITISGKDLYNSIYPGDYLSFGSDEVAPSFPDSTRRYVVKERHVTDIRLETPLDKTYAAGTYVFHFQKGKDDMPHAYPVRVFIDGVEVTEHLVGDAEWLSTSPTRKFSLKSDAFVFTEDDCKSYQRYLIFLRETSVKQALFTKRKSHTAIDTPVIAQGDSLTVQRHYDTYYMPVFAGRIHQVTVMGDELQVEARSFTADLKLTTTALDTKQDLEYLQVATCTGLGVSQAEFMSAKTKDAVEQIQKTAGSLAPQPQRPMLAIPHEGKLLLTFPGEGEDLMVLHMPDPVSGENKPVLRLKRNSELDIDPCWRRHTGDLALQFWRAVADVCHTLPPPVSPKQEAIIAFCTEKKMPLKEFDAWYYAEPVNHGEVVDPGVRVYWGTGKEPYAWGIYPIEPWPENGDMLVCPDMEYTPTRWETVDSSSQDGNIGYKKE
jgi:hypothetical protein